MAKSLATITISAPVTDPSIAVNATFTFTCTKTFVGSGGVTAYDLDFQFDDSGAGTNWVSIGAATKLSTTDTNPLSGLTAETPTSITVKGSTAGTYGLRIVNTSRSLTSSTFTPVTVTSTSPTKTPAQGATTLVGYAPSHGISHLFTPGAGSTALVGYAPTLVQAHIQTPDAGDAALSGHAPTVTDAAPDLGGGGPGMLLLLNLNLEPQAETPITVTPDQGAASLTGHAPTVGESHLLTPAAGALAAVGYAPSVGSSFVIKPAAGALSAAGYAPAVLASLRPLPAAGSAVLAGQAPTVLVSRRAAPDAASMAIAGYAPTLGVSFLFTPAAGSLTAEEQTPSILLSGALSPSQGVLALSGKTPAMGVSYVFRPAAGALSAASTAQAILVSLSANPAAGAAALAGHAPTVLASVSLSPAAGAASLAGHAPTVGTSGAYIPAAGSLALAGQAPTVVDSTPDLGGGGPGLLLLLNLNLGWSNVTYNNPTSRASLTGKAPAVGVSFVIQPDAASLAAEGYDPFPAGSDGPQLSRPNPATLGLTGNLPGVYIGKRVTIPFTSSAEGFVGSPGAGTVMSWTGAAGNPPGSLSTRTTGRNRNAYNVWTLITDWASLGIPAETVITAIELPSALSQVSEYNIANPGSIGPVTMIPTGEPSIELAAARGAFSSVDGGWLLSSGAGTTGRQISSGGSLQIQMSLTLATRNNTNAAVTVLQDQITFVVTYTAAKELVPPVCNASLTGMAPTVLASAAEQFEPATGAGVLIGRVPTVQIQAQDLGGGGPGTLLLLNLNLERTEGLFLPAAGQLGITGYETTQPGTLYVRGFDEIVADVATLTSVNVRVIYASDKNFAPAAGALGLTGQAPTPADTKSYKFDVPATELVFGDVVTDYGISYVLLPDAGALALEGIAPQPVFSSPTFGPAAGTLGLSGQAPEIEIWPIAMPPAGAATLEGYAPDLIYELHLAMTAGAAALTGYAPSLQYGVEFYPAAGDLTATGHVVVGGGFKGWNGTGTLQAQTARLSGTGKVIRYVDVALTARVATLTVGTGRRVIYGSGTLQAGRASLQAQIWGGSGVLEAGLATMIGAGTVRPYTPPDRRLKPNRVNRYNVILKPNKRTRIKRPNTRKPQR